MNHRLASPAVTNQRHQAAASLDYFPTPPFAARADRGNHHPDCWAGRSVNCTRSRMRRTPYGSRPYRYFLRTPFSDVYDWGEHPPSVTSLSRRGQHCKPLGTRSRVDHHQPALQSPGRVRAEGAGDRHGRRRDVRPYQRLPARAVTIGFTATGRQRRRRLCRARRSHRGRLGPGASTATDYIWLVFIKGEAPRPTFFFPPGMAAKYTASPISASPNQAKPPAAPPRARPQQRQVRDEGNRPLPHRIRPCRAALPGALPRSRCRSHPRSDPRERR